MEENERSLCTSFASGCLPCQLQQDDGFGEKSIQLYTRAAGDSFIGDQGLQNTTTAEAVFLHFSAFSCAHITLLPYELAAAVREKLIAGTALHLCFLTRLS